MNTLPINPPPVTAIVIFRNEKDNLKRCLRALWWCDEIIAIDMESSDGSLAIAKNLADRVLSVPLYPIAEPTRVAAVKLARHDWVLLVDPDEHIPDCLAKDMRRALCDHPKAAAFRVPMWYYFKRKRLTGTVWGTLIHKRQMIHRRRCAVLPFCNRITQPYEGYEDVQIPHTGDNHVRHYWSNSYLDLLHKHFVRYAHCEAAAQVAHGQRFNLHSGLIYPIRELYKCLRHFDGLRLGPRGWALSAIYFGYTLLSSWLTLYYQWRGAPPQEPTEHKLPTLTEDTDVSNERRLAA